MNALKQIQLNEAILEKRLNRLNRQLAKENLKLKYDEFTQANMGYILENIYSQKKIIKYLKEKNLVEKITIKYKNIQTFLKDEVFNSNEVLIVKQEQHLENTTYFFKEYSQRLFEEIYYKVTSLCKDIEYAVDFRIVLRDCVNFSRKKCFSDFNSSYYRNEFVDLLKDYEFFKNIQRDLNLYPDDFIDPLREILSIFLYFFEIKKFLNSKAKNKELKVLAYFFKKGAIYKLKGDKKLLKVIKTGVIEERIVERDNFDYPDCITHRDENPEYNLSRSINNSVRIRYRSALNGRHLFHRSPRMHIRKAHWKNARNGRRVFIRETIVNQNNLNVA